MRTLIQHIHEKLIINDKLMKYSVVPKTFKELREIIQNRCYKKDINSIVNLNDIDVSNIESFYDESRFLGLFSGIEIYNIDISKWDVSRVTNMNNMFYDCYTLRSTGDLRKWDVSNVIYFNCMFMDCVKLEDIGDISEWKFNDNLNSTKMMFYSCTRLKFIGDVENWNIPQKTDINGMFYGTGIKYPSWYSPY